MGIIDNALTRVFGPAPTETRSGMPAALVPANRSTPGSGITVGEAMTLPAVYRAISVLSTTVKQMSIDVVRDNRVINNLLVQQPNPLTSRSVFIEQTVVSLATQGNAYWHIRRSDSNRISALIPLNPLDMIVETDLMGNVVRYQYQGVDVPVNEIKHLRLIQPPGSALGLGPIQAASASLRGAAELRDYASKWFDESGVPSGILKTDQFVSDEQVAAAKAAWNATAGAKNGVAVLGSNWSYLPIYLKPEELQFLQNQSYSVIEVARLFGIPSSLMLIGIEGNSNTYTNVEQELTAFVRFTVMQYLMVIEDALSDFLVGRQRARFNIEAILRPDTQTRYDSYKSGIEAGWLTVDEIRVIENLRPLSELNIPQEGDTNV